jgi:hypothetical protein
MFPQADHSPPCLTKPPIGGSVALFGLGNLRSPEAGIVPRHDAMLGAAMPEAAVDEDRKPETWENYIRTAR